MIRKKIIFSFSLFILFLLIFIFYSSCRKENKNPSWDVDLLVPLVNSTLTINNIIPDSFLNKNPDNSFDLVYNTKLYSLSSDTLFSFPNTSLDTAYWLPFSVNLSPSGTIVPPTTDQTKNATGDVQLTSVTLRSGKMLLKIRSQVQSMIDFTYKIPSAKSSQGIVFDTTFRIPSATAAKDGIYSTVFDLSGYKLDLTGLNGDKVNTVVTYHAAIISPLPYGNTVTVTPGDSVVISNSFIDIVPEYAKGYFGSTLTKVGPDSSAVTLFNHIIDGTLNLEDIDINFNIENSIGADARITIDNLTSVNTRTGNSVPLTHSIIGSAINLNRAVDNVGNVSPSLYTFSIKPSNSNIKSFVENLPDKMMYQMDFQINPLGNVSGSNDFVYYNKLMKTEMNMTIPLSLIANDLTMADTMDFNMGKESENINNGNLYLYAENGFPFTAEAQLYMMDENYSIVDSLISIPNSILSPTLDANFICVGKQNSKLQIPVDAAKMDLLRATKKMYMKIKFNTAGKPSYVKIYSFYEMHIKLVGDFNYTVGKKN